MDVIVFNVTGVEAWYVVDPESLELIAKYSMDEVYPKVRVGERETRDLPQMMKYTYKMDTIGAVTALNGKYIIMTAPLSTTKPLRGRGTSSTLGYFIVNTRTWEVEYRIPAVSVKAAAAVDWPQYSRYATNIRMLDELFDDEKAIKRMILAARRMNSDPAYWDMLLRPTVSEDRYLLLALRNEWKIYDLKSGEWVGEEEQILLTGFTIRRPMGIPEWEWKRRLIAEYRIPDYVLHKVFDWWGPEVFLMPKRLRLVYSFCGNFYMVFDPLKWEVVNFTREGWGGWPLHLNIALKEEGVLEEYGIPIREPITDRLVANLYPHGFSFGADNRLVFVVSHENEEFYERGIKPYFIVFFVDESGRICEHRVVRREHFTLMHFPKWWPKDFVVFSGGETVFIDGEFKFYDSRHFPRRKALRRRVEEEIAKMYGYCNPHVFGGDRRGSFFSFSGDRVAYPLTIDFYSGGRSGYIKGEPVERVEVYACVRSADFGEFWGPRRIDVVDRFFCDPRDPGLGLVARTEWLRI